MTRCANGDEVVGSAVGRALDALCRSDVFVCSESIWSTQRTDELPLVIAPGWHAELHSGIRGPAEGARSHEEKEPGMKNEAPLWSTHAPGGAMRCSCDGSVASEWGLNRESVGREAWSEY